MTLVPRLQLYLGARRLVIVSYVAFAVFMPLIPTTAFIQSRILLWICVIFFFTCFQLTACCGILAVHVLVSTSVAKDTLAAAMGLVAFFLSASRSISTIFCGSLFSWSLTNVRQMGNESTLGFPFDVFFVFLLLSLLSLISAAIARKLLGSMDTIH